MIRDYSFYLILDEQYCAPENMVKVMTSLLATGITCVQLRMKKSSDKIITSIGADLLDLLQPHAIPLILNDKIHLVKTIGADGLHIGQTDIPYLAARDQLGPDKIIGLTIENQHHAEHCCQFDVDYFGVGPIFATASKQDASIPLEIIGLQKIIPLLPKPIIAIGGIQLNNLLPLLKTSISGIAVISAILNTPDPAKSATEFSTLIHTYRENHDNH